MRLFRLEDVTRIKNIERWKDGADSRGTDIWHGEICRYVIRLSLSG